MLPDFEQLERTRKVLERIVDTELDQKTIIACAVLRQGQQIDVAGPAAVRLCERRPYSGDEQYVAAVNELMSHVLRLNGPTSERLMRDVRTAQAQMSDVPV